MKKVFTYKFVFITFTFIFALSVFVISENKTCLVSASHTTPIEYCLQQDIVITNNGVTNLTNYPVRILINAQNMIAANQSDIRGWDILPVIGSINNEIELIQQDLTITNAPFWFIIPSLPAGEFRTVRMYMGNNDVRRDQGFYFQGSEEIRKTHEAVFSITDNLRIEIILNTTDLAADKITTQTVLDKIFGFTGYRVEFDGLGNILFVPENPGTCTLAWNNSWSNRNTEFTFRYVSAAGNDTFIDVDGVTEISCDLDLGLLTGNGEDLLLGVRRSGSGLLENTVIRKFRLINGTTTVLNWGFDPTKISENDAINPFGGTVQDYSGNNFTGTYIINSDQSDISFTIGTAQLVDLTDFPFVPDDANSVVGLGILPDFLTPIPTVNSGPLYTLFVEPLENTANTTGLPEQGLIAAGFYAMGLILAVMVWRFTGGFMPAVIMAIGIGPVIAVMMGWVASWWLILWGFTIVVTWLAQRRSEQSV